MRKVVLGHAECAHISSLKLSAKRQPSCISSRLQPLRMWARNCVHSACAIFALIQIVSVRKYCIDSVPVQNWSENFVLNWKIWIGIDKQNDRKKIYSSNYSISILGLICYENNSPVQIGLKHWILKICLINPLSCKCKLFLRVRPPLHRWIFEEVIVHFSFLF